MGKAISEKDAKRIKIRYYAVFREMRGLQEETLETEASTAGELYDRLREEHHFTLPRKAVRVAINDAFVGWDDPLHAGDELVFIPPVAGG